MRISVILSTYNSPAWLEKVLWGYSAQSHRDFELIFADDGSTQQTADLIHRFQAESDLAIRHLWHRDRGFRKCVILNLAIREASEDYLVFSDGDCIPRSDFVAQHSRLARQGHFLSGGIVRLPIELSRRVGQQDILSGRVYQWKWLAQQGMRSWGQFKKLHLLACGSRLAPVADRITTTRATWNGHNTSAWRRDLLAVNGFDQRMKYGGLDRELGERLVNAGISPRQIRHRALSVHLDHPRIYATPESWRHNRDIRLETRASRRVWADHGIQPGPPRPRIFVLPASSPDWCWQPAQAAT